VVNTIDEDYTSVPGHGMDMSKKGSLLTNHDRNNSAIKRKLLQTPAIHTHREDRDMVEASMGIDNPGIAHIMDHSFKDF
jgi:hypothetical protein